MTTTARTLCRHPLWFHRCVDKVMAFIWVLFLVTGPNVGPMKWFLDLTRSLTTDLGVELHMLDSPCYINVWFAWCLGKPMIDLEGCVLPTSRLFKKALRIGGWSHCIAGTTHSAVKQCEKWPAYLQYTRALCKWFRYDECDGSRVVPC